MFLDRYFRPLSLSLYFLFLFYFGLIGNAFSAPSKLDKNKLAGKPPMEFVVARVCDGSQNCKESVLAQGWINSNTLNLAKSQFKSWPNRVDLVFNSDGGDLITAMELGRWIRENQLNTRIGAAKPNQDKTKSRADTELGPGRCLSACVLSFMGGVNRTVDPSDVVGFHGLVLTKSNQMSMDATRSTSQNSDVERAKQAMNAIGRYIESMGGDRRMVDFMLFAKGEQFQRVPFDRIRQLGIDNQVEQPLNAWRLQATDNGTLIALVSEKQNKGPLLVTLALTKASANEGPAESLRLIVFVKSQGSRSLSPDIQNTFSETLPFKIITRRSVIREKLIASWRPNGDGMQLILNLSNPALQDLTQSLSFEIEFDFPSTNLTFERTTRFGTQGLKGALTALRK